MENIDLKFEVMEIKEKSKLTVGSPPVNLPVSKAWKYMIFQLRTISDKFKTLAYIDWETHRFVI